MLHRNIIKLTAISLMSTFLITPVSAQKEMHTIVAPACLLKNMQAYPVLSSQASLRLIQVDEPGLEKLIESKNKKQQQPCGGFIDVSAKWKAFQTKQHLNNAADTFLKKYTHKAVQESLEDKEYKIQYSEQVNNLYKQMNPQDIWSDLTTFTAFPDRYSRSDNGVKAAEWIKDKVGEMAKANNRDDVSIYTVATGNNYKQPSVVVKFGNSNEPGIVIGGHMDTLSSAWELKPGADDDGSGSMTLMEVARTFLSSGMHFKHPIYFIWYAAEEMGLVGSQYVVQDFKRKNIPVDAVLQFDMTGYAYKKDPTIWLINDHVNVALTSYLETLVKNYLNRPVDYTKCGYACSDHASWSQEGYLASFPFESSFGHDDPYIHTSQDKIEVLTLDHMFDFAKLGVAFGVELAEPA